MRVNTVPIWVLLFSIPTVLFAMNYGPANLSDDQNNATVSANKSVDGLTASNPVVAADEVNVGDGDDGTALENRNSEQLNLSDGQSNNWWHRRFYGYGGLGYGYGYGYGWGYPYSSYYYPMYYSYMPYYRWLY